MQGKRTSQSNGKPNLIMSPQAQKAMLIQQIKQQQKNAQILNMQVMQKRKEMQKIKQSNQRNTKRILRTRAKMEQMHKYRNKPQYFLQVSGFMNQYVQSFILSHNYQFEAVQTSDPDQMSYEQLIALGQKIGRVSKGIPRKVFEQLPRTIVNPDLKQNLCSVCYSEYEKGQRVIILPCKHYYHEECIDQWLRDENNCPMCKESVVQKS